MLSRNGNISYSKTGKMNQISVQKCSIHGKTLYLQHMINSRCALCDGYSREEIRKIIRRNLNKQNKIS